MLCSGEECKLVLMAIRGQLVTVVKKKFKDLENKSLSTACKICIQSRREAY